MDDTLSELKKLLLKLYAPDEAFEWLFAPNAEMADTIPISRMQHGYDQTFEIVKHLRRELSDVEADYSSVIHDDTLD